MVEAGEKTESEVSRLGAHLYGAGHFGTSFLGYILVAWVSRFYFPGEEGITALVPAALAPWLMTLGRVTDGINDPLIGYLSDITRTRWGRRKPLMAIGLPFVLLFSMLVWYPPSTETTASNFWYGAVMLTAFFAAFTFYVGPYVALLAEIAHTTEERTKIAALQGIYNVAGLIAAGFVSGIALKSGLSYQAMATLVAGISGLFMVLPFFGPRDDLRTLKDEVPQRFVKGLVETFANRPFRIYLVGQVFFLLGLMMIVTAMPYMTTTLLGEPEGEAGILTGLALLSGALWVAYAVKRAERNGTKEAFLFSLLWFVISAASLALFAVLGKTGELGVWLARALVLLPGAAIGGLFALPYAILANVTDYDRALTGRERQGFLFCFQGMILKIAYSAAPMVVVGLLVLFPDHKFGVLTAIGPLAGLFALVGYLVFRRYPDREVDAAVTRAPELVE